ncbi:CMRF35-like molecule 7 [Polypterus senegalus]|uniref:CMRF35-like molecule 7 n=1 Tax=Polypterus senegalus TaxID=55291 RepID=UPI0019655C70|nr:CMRF35-like molecule 7 [Polypterus senegalus]
MSYLTFALLTLSGVIYLRAEKIVSGWEHGAVSIPCQYPTIYRYNVKYLCKGPLWKNCTTVISSDKLLSGDSRLSIHDNKNGLFNVSFTGLLINDTSRYWCALKGIIFKPHYSLNLAVSGGFGNLTLSNISLFGEKGGSASIHCTYIQQYDSALKYWCKGNHLGSCKALVSGEKISHTDNKTA